MCLDGRLLCNQGKERGDRVSRSEGDCNGPERVYQKSLKVSWQYVQAWP